MFGSVHEKLMKEGEEVCGETKACFLKDFCPFESKQVSGFHGALREEDVPRSLKSRRKV